ncbi:uncharacterized protein LOC128817005 [Vidua macroura]|uniref:uncharacterized protein LOC128817005 n=1 Tax=Vidua macroura TaxID=187451 RepID=UPI0023A8741B|nr:uncharacterized protein LOC128817005 [Vidua macroura]
MGWTSPGHCKEKEESLLWHPIVSAAGALPVPETPIISPPSRKWISQRRDAYARGSWTTGPPGALAAAPRRSSPAVGTSPRATGRRKRRIPRKAAPALPRTGQREPGAAPPTCRPPPLCPPAAGTSPAPPEPRALPARPRFPLRSFPCPSRGRAGPGRAGERRQLRQRHRLRAPGHGGLSAGYGRLLLGKLLGFPGTAGCPPTPSRARPLLLRLPPTGGSRTALAPLPRSPAGLSRRSTSDNGVNSALPSEPGQTAA